MCIVNLNQQNGRWHAMFWHAWSQWASISHLPQTMSLQVACFTTMSPSPWPLCRVIVLEKLPKDNHCPWSFTECRVTVWWRHLTTLKDHPMHRSRVLVALFAISLQDRTILCPQSTHPRYLWLLYFIYIQSKIHSEGTFSRFVSIFGLHSEQFADGSHTVLFFFNISYVSIFWFPIWLLVLASRGLSGQKGSLGI